MAELARTPLTRRPRVLVHDRAADPESFWRAACHILRHANRLPSSAHSPSKNLGLRFEFAAGSEPAEPLQPATRSSRISGPEPGPNGLGTFRARRKPLQILIS